MTVPTFPRAHKFCASRQAYGLSVTRMLGFDAINYAIRYTTKMKAKFSSCDQIKFNEPALKSGTPE